MAKTIINAPEAVAPLPVYSHATINNGTIYVSGSIGADKDRNLKEGVQEQTHAALQNMQKILQAAGADLENVLKCNVYLANIQKDFTPMNEIYIQYFPKNPPARTCIGVAALPMGALVEVECIAEKP